MKLRKEYAMSKKKKPIVKKLLMGALIVAVVLVAVDYLLSDPNYVPKDEREYTEVTVDQLFEELDDNALNAKDKYTDAYVSITGKLHAIDSDGESIGLYPLEYESLDDVHCILTDDAQRDKIKGYSSGDTITVKGRITRVDSAFPYTLDIDSID